MLPNLIGCEDFPRSEQGLLLIEDLSKFINNTYGYNATQVLEAFNQAVTYNLYLDGKRVDPSTFGKHLSRASIGKVLTAYRETKRTERRTHLGLPEPDDRSDIITPLESWELCLKWYKEEGEPTLIAPYLGAYTYLVEQKLIKPIKKVSNKRFSDNFDSSEALAVKNYLKLKQ